jgi:ATP-dependent helicase HrpB
LVRLPIDAHLAEITALVEKNPNLLLQAQPGTGKTTRVPSHLLEAPFCRGREIWVLEPRRLAAKMAARRVASERGEEVGQTVGYQFRFENVGGPRTRLRFLTEGMVLRHLMSDPQLSKVAAVILDEFHERHLHGDIALAALRRLQKTERPDLRLVVMSATLRTEELEKYLDQPAQISIAAPHYPLTVRYSPMGETYLDKAVARAVRDTLSATDYPGGDFLVFLPGMSDIRRAETALAPFVRERGLALHLLHGELSKEEQDRAVQPGTKTKVILSTNVAESSLTIEGVSVVIDSGLHRSASYSSWSGMPSLRTRNIAKASAIQRAGRAARTGPGLCVRLYSQGEFDHLPPQETPEVQRADLAQTLLELKCLGAQDEEAFEWFEVPSQTSLQAARTLLWRLGALDAANNGAAVTPLGREIAKIPAHPRLARLLWEAQKRGCASEGVALVGLLSEGLLESLDALDAVRGAPVPERLRKQLSRFLTDSSPKAKDWREALAFSVLTAFGDRVGKLRPSGTELVLSTGGTVATPTLQGFGQQYFVVLDARETQGFNNSRGQVRAASVVGIEPEWLFDLQPSSLVDEIGVEWDAQRKRVTGKTRLRYDQLVLEESDSPVEEYEKAAEVLLRSALSIRRDKMDGFSVHEWVEALLPVASKEALESVFARQALAAQYSSKESFPSISELVLQAVMGKTSLEELKDLDWESALLPAEKFGRLFPSQIALPDGRKVKVQYALGRAPWVESRLQDFFGMKQGPTILDGRVPLTLHLMAPNHQAVQVTTDLAGFWKNTYPAVRRELSRNYPRHSWPEDPANATPPPPRKRR